jgi:hypothetical protein
MGGPMVKIRYADLPGGLHAQAEARGRHAIVYLRPGLTPAQRREGLRRARQTARMGYGPSLPAADVQVALAVDRVRITVRNAMAAVCQHPASSVLLAGLLSAAVACYMTFVSVSITFIHPPFLQAQQPRAGLVSGAPPTAGAGPVAGGQPGADAPAPGTPGPGSQRGASPGASPEASSQPSPGQPGSSPQPTDLPSPTATPTGLPGPTPTPTGVCLVVGPLGVCLSL